MSAEVKTEKDLLDGIDRLEMSERLFALKDAMFGAPRKISVDRARLAVESWKETEGEDIERRRAKLFKKVLENVPIAIYPFDTIVGRETEHLVGAPVFVDETGDAIPGLWNDEEVPRLFRGALSAEDRKVLRECACYFRGKTAPDHVKEEWRSLVGTWAADITDAKGSDPTPDSGYFPGITCRAMWEKILSVGMRGLIEEAEASLRRFRDMEETDISKYWFWQSAVIVCEAMITYARRYAALAREQAEKESDAARRRCLRTRSGAPGPHLPRSRPVRQLHYGRPRPGGYVPHSYRPHRPVPASLFRE